MESDILALGEPMVEFNQTGAGGGRMYLQGFGGDTSNAAIAAARQGARAGYLSALGDDVYGGMLRELWRREGVDASGVRTDAGAFTAAYFVTHDAQGHHFSFFRQGSAASRMRPQDLPRERIARAKVPASLRHLRRDLRKRLRHLLRGGGSGEGRGCAGRPSTRTCG